MNPRHEDFQSSALPTELPDHILYLSECKNTFFSRISQIFPKIKIIESCFGQNGVHEKLINGTNAGAVNAITPKSAESEVFPIRIPINAAELNGT